MTSQLESSLYIGHVMHLRQRPARVGFRYRTCSTCIDLAELDQLESALRPWGFPLFGYRRRGIVRFLDHEYMNGDDPQRTLREHVIAWAQASGADIVDDASVQLITNLRTFGYVFNPISIFVLRNPADERATHGIAEVHNTFGERHRYLVPFDTEHETDKHLHVSPFMPMDQRYRMRIAAPDDRLSVRIELLDERAGFVATWSGRRQPLTSKTLARSLFTHPFGPQIVMLRIHLQAFRLWRKKVPFFRKPPFVEGKGSEKKGPA
jgi:DUF1365 family protein